MKNLTRAKVRPGQNQTVELVKSTGETIAEVTVTIDNGAIQVFVHRHEGHDLPVKTTVI